MNHKPEKIHGYVQEIERLMEKEEMQALLGDFYGNVGRKYREIRDLSRAREYGALALEHTRRYAGYDHEKSDKAFAFVTEVEALLAKRRHKERKPKASGQ